MSLLQLPSADFSEPRYLKYNTLDTFNVRLPRLATIVHRGTFALWILGRPYILGISSGIDNMFERRRDSVLSLPSLNHFGQFS